jgi:hypothetical protein
VTAKYRGGLSPNSFHSGKLDPKDLIQLLPEEERPSRKAARRDQLMLDSDGKITTLDEPYTAFDKDFQTDNILRHCRAAYLQGNITHYSDRDTFVRTHNIGLKS